MPSRKRNATATHLKEINKKRIASRTIPNRYKKLTLAKESSENFYLINKDIFPQIDPFDCELDVLKKFINKKINQAYKIIQNYDPLRLLQYIFVQHELHTIGGYSESTTFKIHAVFEYAQNLVLSEKEFGFEKEPPLAIMKEFNHLLMDIIRQVPIYFSRKIVAENRKSLSLANLQFAAINQFLLIRGPYYYVNGKRYIQELFAPHDKFLKLEYGFGVNELLNCEEEIYHQIVRKIEELDKKIEQTYDSALEILSKIPDDTRKYASKSKPTVDTDPRLHNYFTKFQRWKYTDEIEGEDIDPITGNLLEQNLDITRLPPQQTETIENLIRKIKYQITQLKENLLFADFKIRNNEKCPENILSTISLTFGDNVDFKTFPKSPGWPSNNSLIYENPLINYNGEYYCFGIKTFVENYRQILERLIQKADEHYFTTEYEHHIKPEYLEIKTIELLNHLLPGAKVYRNLYYKKVENGKSQQYETDGLILYDDNVFIIEVKAVKYTLPAKRAAPQRLQADLKDLLKKPYDQAIRTRDYIRNEQQASFSLKNGEKVSINRNVIRNFFIINVTLEDLGYLCSKLKPARESYFLKGTDWPWAVNINDLSVISDLIDSPSLFLLYLKNRVKINERSVEYNYDEMDFLGSFLSGGFKELLSFSLKEQALIVAGNIAQGIDEYYLGLQIPKRKRPKPLYPLPEFLQVLIRKIEESQKPCFSFVTSTILNFDPKELANLAVGILDCVDRSLQDRTLHNMTLIRRDDSIGIVIATISHNLGNPWEEILNYSRKKQYEIKLFTFISILINWKSHSCAEHVFDVNFSISEKSWEFNEELDKEIKESIRKARWSARSKKTGRNEFCPCGSGLKYKFCHGKK